MSKEINLLLIIRLQKKNERYIKKINSEHLKNINSKEEVMRK